MHRPSPDSPLICLLHRVPFGIPVEEPHQF